MSSQERESTLDYLKKEFTKRWPDADKAIKAPFSVDKKEASCLWMGFKEGYALAMVRPDD